MKEKISMILFVLILGSVLTLALLAVDTVTAPLIKRNEEIKVKRNVLQALEIPCTKENAETVFDNQVTVLEKDGKVFYRSQQNTTAFEIEGPGVWGAITGVLALAEDNASISGITIIAMEETPGLGTRIGEPPFITQFKGKDISAGLVLVGEGKSSSDTEIDGITGATLSSKAFVSIINQQYGVYAPRLKE